MNNAATKNAAAKDNSYGYTKVEWLELAPGEKVGGREILRESRFWDADFGIKGAANAAEAKAAALRASGCQPTVKRAASKRLYR